MSRRRRLSTAFTFLTTVLIVIPTSPTVAGLNNIRNNSIGGISIDGAGVVRQRTIEAKSELLKLMKKEIEPSPAEMTRPVGLRMISLRALEDAIKQARKDNFGTLPEEMEFLAGIQRIEYIFLYPEQNDIVLAGPGEGWRVDENANVVGVTTGRPVLMLDDLLVALRSATRANQGFGISCSIDPSEDGRIRFQKYIRSLTNIRGFRQKNAEAAMGLQQITVTGVPANSHFARVMVAADIRMKRYAMGLDQPPVQGLPSFLDLLKAKRSRPTSAMPRWWLACNYEPLARSEDGLAWQIRGAGAKAMTEDELISKDGTLKGPGGKNPVAQQWADLLTEKYAELAQKETIFGELRNLMDLCVVAALIEKEEMLNTVGLKLPLMLDQQSDLTIDEWNTPKSVNTQCSLMKVARQYIITASGGVQVESWSVAGKSEVRDEVEQVRSRAKAAGKNAWWWN